MTATGVGASGITNPANAALIPLMSPRVMGEAANAAGVVARKIQPAVDLVARPLNSAQQALAPFRSELQGAAMGSRQVGQAARVAEEDQL